MISTSNKKVKDKEDSKDQMTINEIIKNKKKRKIDSICVNVKSLDLVKMKQGDLIHGILEDSSGSTVKIIVKKKYCKKVLKQKIKISNSYQLNDVKVEQIPKKYQKKEKRYKSL